jgi:hypothetical protein
MELKLSTEAKNGIALFAAGSFRMKSKHTESERGISLSMRHWAIIKGQREREREIES